MATVVIQALRNAEKQKHAHGRKMRYNTATDALLQHHGIMLPDGKPKDMRRSNSAKLDFSDFDAKKKVDVKKNGVRLSIFSNWIKEELDSETSCMELPFTIILLVSFAFLAIFHLRQDTIMKIEDSVETDVIENANFAWAHAFGHKGIYDVNSYGDFWSWTRLGLFPLLVSERPWWYSEGLDTAVPPTPGKPAYNVDALPSPRNFSGYRQAIPMKNDYLRYNRIIGGFRFRQIEKQLDYRHCKFPGDQESYEAWHGKACTGLTATEIIPDAYVAESMVEPARIEWFISETESADTMLQHIVDMEDGCASAAAHKRKCLCEWCDKQPTLSPWLDEKTERIEISFLIYNAQYGLYSMCGVNFWFNRAGHISKLVYMRSAWAGLATRSVEDLVWMGFADVIWLCSVMNMLRAEVMEIFSLVTSKQKPWYETLADDYIGFWNLIDWISILIALIILATWVVMFVATSNVNYYLGEVVKTDASGSGRSDLIRVIYDAAESMFQSEATFRFWLSLYPLVVMLRLFKSFAAQPRLAIVTETFNVAKTDIMHFSIVFFSVWFCFSMNAVLFFGQDVKDFATLDRAILSSFRAMFGDWDWDAMLGIGIWRAFLWFSIFMVVLVLILLNMLLAILMGAYVQVKDGATDAVTLIQQIKTMGRRAWQTRKKERVRLNEIWDALLVEEDGDDSKMLSNDEKLIFPEYLQDKVEGIDPVQAGRTLTSAQKEWNRKNTPPFSVEFLQAPMEALSKRVLDSAKCSVWLSLMFNEYQKNHTELKGSKEAAVNYEEAQKEHLARQSLASFEKDFGNMASLKHSNGSKDGPSVDAISEMLMREAEEEEANMQEELERSRSLAETSVDALAEDIGAVVAEEIQCVERRQKQQEASMEQLNAALVGVRTLVYKLHQTCAEIAGAVESGGGHASAQAIALGGGPSKRTSSKTSSGEEQRNGNGNGDLALQN